MDILFGASIVASFLAGMVALFAPCCITVLLPAYIASAFREKKKMLQMTFIFFAGIATILVPIGLGAAGLAELFQNFHKELWIFGGLFMLVLGVFSLQSRSMSLPLPAWMKAKLRIEGGMHGKSVYALGILSGAATSCCAPVLAGAVTLAVLSGTFWNALIVTFAYVFGMVFPLFLTAYFYDKFKIDQSKLIKGKMVKLSFIGKEMEIHSTNLLAGVMFFLFGGVMLLLGLSGNAYWAPEHQVALGESLNRWTLGLFRYLENIPNSIWVVVVLAIFGAFIYALNKQNKDK
ncbi:MAG: hypothetical protein COU09_00315 [Candidatus Harrisonbacteria bacterium CG10_big_fil_rev_8_21_14_0_10_44_23]|uniref:Cytochrome C biogenesis protein transmembrane domain-containing protein n=1 Tax=Candidatus Harrisonbacteria bacterium CG10_big_fil_rev_8_21_14_0_10_44_23 TaxID=1974585 RepID=A0A2H0UQV7_9BACT|nr:MAG: hypothetical protein COU09_00315 [Candidatus Harrisonbacteria bacterium CG10_big_fil_rev_8_21_14_0_10_44_23]